MELQNIATGGVFECDDEMGNRLLAEGGYTTTKEAAPVKKAPAKHAPRKATGAH